MSEAAQKFNGSYEPVAAGEYLVTMNQEPKFQKTKAGDDKINIGFKILGGENEGRLVFMDFLIGHSKDNVRKIAEDQLNGFLKAAGLNGGLDDIGNDYSQLTRVQHMPVIARVKVEDEREYTAADGSTRVAKAKNKITSFKAR